MAKYVNVNGIWKQQTESYVNVNGVWKQQTESYVNVNGVWKQDVSYPMFVYDSNYILTGSSISNLTYGFAPDGFYISGYNNYESGGGTCFLRFNCEQGNGIVLKKGDVIIMNYSATWSNTRGVPFVGIYLEYHGGNTYQTMITSQESEKGNNMSMTHIVTRDLTTTYPFRYIRPNIQVRKNSGSSSPGYAKITIHSVTLNGQNILKLQ